ncbi:type II-A CRISPR-associated protein Csn2 [Dehalobacterium formicoaceticum]|uniref:Type II-A CRISPR-associated protein Csn2 n=1 Tax=Dehalobacterium formicoaceticum TaxID=51515 RepID=A0ABT1Y768_9FIRM|nr:type II-A CRISPR-associated protein Csn2 [Dehalobacterium formicoaceticum]MCR6546740.1 type II-A CRISPR-associated protein Csn2 [Dehalobacterium formicoaceticum]
MKLAHPLLERPIVFEENKINVLVIENQKAFSEIVWELMEQINDGEGQFVLSSDLTHLELQKYMDLVIDLFSLDFNQKRIINKVYSKLKMIAVESEYYVDSTGLISEIMRYLEKILQEIHYPLEYNQEMDIGAIFKFADVKIGTDYETIIEKTIDYLTLLQEFIGIKLFVFINLKCYLSDQDLEQLYQFVIYNKYDILLLENTMREKRFQQEKIRIIDGDLCEI